MCVLLNEVVETPAIAMETPAIAMETPTIAIGRSLRLCVLLSEVMETPAIAMIRVLASKFNPLRAAHFGYSVTVHILLMSMFSCVI